MRRHGTRDGVEFHRGGYCLRNQGYYYKLRKDGALKEVYVNNITELKAEIEDFIDEEALKCRTNQT